MNPFHTTSGLPVERPQSITHDILYPGSNALLRLHLPKGAGIRAESGAMVAASEAVEVKGKLEGGLMRGLARKLLAREKLFFQTLTADGGDGEVFLAPASLGDIHAVQMEPDRALLVQKDGFLCASGDLDIRTAMQGIARGLFSGEGFFVLKISGTGTVFLSAFGAIHAIDIPAEQTVVIDNKHLVAWPADTPCRIEPAAKGWISSVTSGEVLVCRFTGPARVLIQTRNGAGFGSWLSRSGHLRPRRRSSAPVKK